MLVAAASGLSACHGAESELTSRAGSAASTSETTNCTAVADPTGSIADASGNSWTLVGSGVGAFTVDENGAPAGYTAEVTRIVYVNHALWQQNAAGGWWFWQGGTWVAGADPTTTCPSESASCTSVTSTSGTITDTSGNAWSLASSASDGLIVDENGATAGYSAQVTELAYVDHVVWQQNAAGGWWSWQAGDWVGGPDPTTACSGHTDAGGGAGASGSPPPAALAAGYDTLTYGPNVTLGQNWIENSEDGTAVNATQNADGSVTVSGGGDTWNAQIASYVGGIGETFGGGFYTQATVTVPGPTSGLSPWTGGTWGNQWPSFWANSVNGSIETDYMEMMGPTPGEYGATVINWTTTPQTGYGQSIYAPDGNELHGPNTFGFLWIPATATTQGSMTFYLNDQAVGSPITWSQAQPGLYGIIDGQQMVLRFGAGANSPATFSNIEVWQASTAGDLINGQPAPFIAPSR